MPKSAVRQRFRENGVPRHVISDINFCGRAALLLTVDVEYADQLLALGREWGLQTLGRDVDVFTPAVMEHIVSLPSEQATVSDMAERKRHIARRRSRQLVSAHENASGCLSVAKRNGLKELIGTELLQMLAICQDEAVINEVKEYFRKIAKNKSRDRGDRDILYWLANEDHEKKARELEASPLKKIDVSKKTRVEIPSIDLEC